MTLRNFNDRTDVGVTDACSACLPHRLPAQGALFARPSRLRHGYPHDRQDSALRTVLQQTEAWADEWSRGRCGGDGGRRQSPSVHPETTLLRAEQLYCKGCTRDSASFRARRGAAQVNQLGCEGAVMNPEHLDLTSLEKAISRLEEGLAGYLADTSQTLIRDGLIQRFEFTYEISHRTLKRFLEAVSATPGRYDAMAFQDVIRAGNAQNLLLGSWPDWRRYREMRSRTSHTYDEQVALEVVTGIPTFLTEVCYLRDQLKARLS
jgi:nucleotidyltransferase substrate binding protein (TIGR01987 family)